MLAHLDADSFFASVLVRKHPHLRGKPLLAVGMGPSVPANGRAGGGCIIAATYEAKAYGVKTGMRLSEARKLVPGAIEMPSDFRETGIASEQIETILRSVCPVVEQMSIDEWFLDLSSLVGGEPANPTKWATDMRLRILRDTDLSMSVGIAPSKLLAKMASEYRKPAGITVLQSPSTGCSSEPGGGVRGGGMNIEAFLRDRPAAAIPGIGRQRKVKTDAANILTAWDLTQADDDLLIRLCGQPGIDMKRELLGELLFPVQTEKPPPKSISRCRTFRATTDKSLLRAHLLKHLEYCTMKMRRQSLVCSGISVHLRTADYAYTIAHRHFAQPCSTVSQMMPDVLSALEELSGERKRWNQVGLALSGLVPAGITQQSIFEDITVSMSDERLQAALDELQTRFGRDSVTRAAALPVKSGTKQELDFSLVEQP